MRSVETFTEAQLLKYMRSHRLAVVATVGQQGEPQGALVGVGSTDALEIVFDTLSTTRKHVNLERDKRVAVTFSGPDEKTLQLQGVAFAVSTTRDEDHRYREAYYATWPEGREHLQWPRLAYWAISPRWARYSDYDLGPLIAEFRWPAP